MSKKKAAEFQPLFLFIINQVLFLFILKVEFKANFLIGFVIIKIFHECNFRNKLLHMSNKVWLFEFLRSINCQCFRLLGLTVILDIWIINHDHDLSIKELLIE